ncbi:tetratricopeptide repeat protein, partial [candidate division CSSED10-310 bacterium]
NTHTPLPHEKLLQSIRREIHVLSQLKHPGIVRIVDQGIADGLPWYAMELVEGLSLRNWCLKPITGAETQPAQAASNGTTAVTGANGSAAWWTLSMAEGVARPALIDTTNPVESSPDPLDTAFSDSTPAAAFSSVYLTSILKVICRLCVPLAYIHSRGLVHRDLKPDNVLVQADGKPIIVDFGLFQQFGGDVSREMLEIDSRVVGTVSYMAPEQIQGGLVDARADLYALGCILYELLTGRRPFEAHTTTDMLFAHLHQTPEPPAYNSPWIPAELNELVLRLLTKDRRLRPGYAYDVAVCLARISGEEEFLPPTDRPRDYLYRSGLAGRLGQLEALRTHLKRLHQGQGGLVLVGGESGVGKTRLALELGLEAAFTEVRVITGECQDGAHNPLSAFLKPLQFVADYCREKGRAETTRILGPRSKVLALYEPSLGILTEPDDFPEPVKLPPAAAQLRLFSYLKQTLQTLAGEKPLLLILDDLQWADDLSLGFLEHVNQGNFFEHHGVLFVGTFRTEEITSGLAQLLNKTDPIRMELGRLEEHAVEAMISDMLAITPAPQHFTSFLARHSEGNPFFVAEFLRTAVSERVIWRDEKGIWQVGLPEQAKTDFETLTLPTSLRDLIGRRLADLSFEARTVMNAAAVVGRESPLVLLNQMLDMDEETMMNALEQLRRRHVLSESNPDVFRFEHDKIRAVATTSLLEEEQIRLHRSAANGLETVFAEKQDMYRADLAYHWERAGDAEKAKPYYLTAARSAVEHYSFQEADKLYRAYLRLDPDPSVQRVLVQLELGADVLGRVGRMREAEEELSQALAEARQQNDATAIAPSLRALGLIHEDTGRMTEAQTLYAEALTLFRKLADTEGQCTTMINLGNIHRQYGRKQEALTLYKKALELARQMPDSDSEATVILCLALLHDDQGRYQEAETLYEQVLRIAIQRNNKRLEGLVYSNLANVCKGLGKIERARNLHEKNLSIARETGHLKSERITLGNLAVLHYEQGHLEEAEGLYKQTIVIAREVGDRRLEGDVLGNLALLHHKQGRLDRAEELYEQALANHRLVGDRSSEGIALGNLANLCRDRGFIDQAQDYYEQALSVSREIGDQRSEGAWLSEQAVLFLFIKGDVFQAEKLIQQGQTLLQGVGDLLEHTKAHCTQGHITLAQGNSAQTMLSEAWAIAAQLNVGPESELATAITRLSQAQTMFEGQEHHLLFRGTLIRDIPPGLRKWLRQQGHLPGPKQNNLTA